VEGVHFRMYFAIAARPLDLIDEQNDHGMIAPVILIGACRREMKRQQLFEEQRAEPLLQAGHKMDHFRQRGSKPVCIPEIFGEFRGDAWFFAELKIKNYMV